ncbi:hypothetical protein EXIGLDRAFT_717789 [Exidia glandulosa HHB12029]|uniref:Uncharacterized protein n=1 Tax=Exidia glandulosa HHB12029 TaxID=1314781 RepID=A0A165I5S9_EXIGL|nr:hypothetical protein EXIGLDRAFT_717789 [Exidia glandulosa HHB12029]
MYRRRALGADACFSVLLTAKSGNVETTTVKFCRRKVSELMNLMSRNSTICARKGNPARERYEVGFYGTAISTNRCELEIGNSARNGRRR